MGTMSIMCFFEIQIGCITKVRTTELNEFSTFSEPTLLVSKRYVSDVIITFVDNHASSALIFESFCSDTTISETPNIMPAKVDRVMMLSYFRKIV